MGGRFGRDPAEILLSSHVLFTGDPAETSASAAALGAAGVQLGIIQLRPPHDPAVLEPAVDVEGGPP